jgi:hypothetical protein
MLVVVSRPVSLEVALGSSCKLALLLLLCIYLNWSFEAKGESEPRDNREGDLKNVLSTLSQSARGVVASIFFLGTASLR